MCLDLEARRDQRLPWSRPIAVARRTSDRSSRRRLLARSLLNVRDARSLHVAAVVRLIQPTSRGGDARRQPFAVDVARAPKSAAPGRTAARDGSDGSSMMPTSAAVPRSKKADCRGSAGSGLDRWPCREASTARSALKRPLSTRGVRRATLPFPSTGHHLGQRHRGRRGVSPAALPADGTTGRLRPSASAPAVEAKSLRRPTSRTMAHPRLLARWRAERGLACDGNHGPPRADPFRWGRNRRLMQSLPPRPRRASGRASSAARRRRELAAPRRARGMRPRRRPRGVRFWRRSFARRLLLLRRLLGGAPTSSFFAGRPTPRINPAGRVAAAALAAAPRSPTRTPEISLSFSERATPPAAAPPRPSRP